MKSIIRTLTILVLSLSLVASPGLADPLTPSEQYAALFKDYRPVSGGMRKAKTDPERKQAVELLSTFAPKFVDLAEKYPDDPITLTVLRQAVQAIGTTDSAAQITWETNRSDFPVLITDESAGRIVTLLLRDHLLSDEIGPVCDRMRYGYRLEFAKCLRTVPEKNPHRDIQGMACLWLAQSLNDRL